MGGRVNKYVFVFSDSIKSTNVQFNELLSLFNFIKSNNINLRYVKLQDFQQIEEIRSENIIYGSKFNQSCVIATNDEEDILDKIISRSSYVHSCGRLIKISNIEQITADEIYKSILEHLDNYGIDSFELSFYSQDKAEEVKNPLLGIMIDQRRTYFSDLPFKRACTDILKRDWEGKKLITNNSDVQARIWIYKDVNEGDTRFVNWDYPEKKDEIYLFIYQPLFRLKNALYTLDDAKEAKPYWKGIDTTPQRLMGAMLNLAQFKEKTTLVDPFSHTGTSILEAVRFNPSRIYFSDKFESQGALDNVILITQPVEKINDVIDQMENIKKRKLPTEGSPNLEIITKAVHNSLVWVRDQPFPKSILPVTTLKSEHGWLDDFATRLVFYYVRRYYIENGIGLLEDRDGSISATYGQCEPLTYGSILHTIEDSLEHSLELLRSFSETRKEIGERKANRGIIDIGYNPTPYCKDAIINLQDTDLCREDIKVPDNSIDTIIADPPYGYGSKEEEDEIKLLYNRFISEFFRIVKPTGYISICVLDKVRTGKTINDQFKTEAIVDKINTIARKSNILFLNSSLRPFEDDKLLLSYWKAKHKLNRGILSYQVYKTIQ